MKCTKTYVIGHENPLPDGDCICSTHAFAHIISLFQNEIKKSGRLLNDIEIIYKAETNPYIQKVLNYIGGCQSYFEENSRFSFTPIKRNFGVTVEKFKRNIWTTVSLHKKNQPNDKLGIAFFVLDTDYKRTGYGELLDNIHNYVKELEYDFGLNNQIELFFGIIDHHIPKEETNLPIGFSNADSNTLELIFSSNSSESRAMSTSEIVMNILISEAGLFCNTNVCRKAYEDDEDDAKEASKLLVTTFGKILLGGMRTDTGNFLFNGHGSTFMVLSKFISTFEIDNEKLLEMDQNLIQSIVEPKKSIDNSKIYSYLNDQIIGIYDFDDGLSDEEYGRFSGFAYMVVDDYHFDEEKKIKISGLGIKPIHVLQEYEWKAAVAITINSIERTLKLELRSSEEKYNCRKLAQAIHPSGGGHLQAAGVTVEVPKEEELFAAAKTLAKQFVDYMKECEK